MGYETLLAVASLQPQPDTPWHTTVEQRTLCTARTHAVVEHNRRLWADHRCTLDINACRASSDAHR